MNDFDNFVQLKTNWWNLQSIRNDLKTDDVYKIVGFICHAQWQVSDLH